MSDLNIQSLGLNKVGLNAAADIIYNPSYETLFEHETNSEAKDWSRGIETDTGAVTVDTGDDFVVAAEVGGTL